MNVSECAGRDGVLEWSRRTLESGVALSLPTALPHIGRAAARKKESGPIDILPGKNPKTQREAQSGRFVLRRGKKTMRRLRKQELFFNIFRPALSKGRYAGRPDQILPGKKTQKPVGDSIGPPSW